MSGNLQIFTHEFYPKRGGIATYCHEFATAAAEMFEEVTVYSPAGGLPPDSARTTYQIQPTANKGSHSPACIWKSSRLLRDNLRRFPKATFLLAEPGPILASGMIPEANERSQTVLVTVHGSEIERWHTNPISHALANRAFQKAHAIQAVSAPVLESLLNYFPHAKGKAKIVRNALPEDYYKASNPEDGVFKKPEDSKIMELLSVGRIQKRKGFDQVIGALSLLPDEDKSRIHYRIAGATKDRAYLKKLMVLAKESGVRTDFSLNPDSDQLKRHYAAADVFALTSMQRKSSIEGFGIVYLEAGAYGLPCLAYDTGGVCEAIQGGMTGILIDAGNVNKLSEEIRFFLHNPQRRREMGRANRTFALSRTWKDVVIETLE